MLTKKSKLFAITGLAILGVGVAWWVVGTPGGWSPDSKGHDQHTSSPSPRIAPPDQVPPARANGTRLDLPSDPQSLPELQRKIESLPAAEAVAFIRKFLAIGRDGDTGLPFEIASDGRLQQSPTFRTFLLDALAALDPAAAAEISRDILATPTSADEWALALRNVGRFEDTTQSRDFLRQKTEELIRNPAWQAEPSIGYLNAFDVLVHTRATESTPLLSGLIQNKERKDLAHAAFLTLDRLVQQQPVEMLGQLADDSALQQSRPEMTAQQFARADLRDPAQREIVQSWLLNSARTATELNSFATTYPNNNQFVSHNLLTSAAPHTGADLAAHDREALDILTSWQDDPAFQPVAAHLNKMLARLRSFTSPPPNRASSREPLPDPDR